MRHESKVQRRRLTMARPSPIVPAVGLLRADGGGPTVRLRPPTVADQEEFLVLTLESRGFHSPWSSPPTTLSAFKSYLERTTQSDFESRVVCHGGDGRILGALNLSQIVRGNFQSAYLGYWVGVRYARKGYMTQAVDILLALAFREMGLHRIEANIQPGNSSSIKLVERCGFRLEGFSPRYLKIRNRWRDHQRWAILREDWQKLRRRPRDERKTPASHSHPIT